MVHALIPDNCGVPTSRLTLPGIVRKAGTQAAKRFVEFFAANNKQLSCKQATMGAAANTSKQHSPTSKGKERVARLIGGSFPGTPPSIPHSPHFPDYESPRSPSRNSNFQELVARASSQHGVGRPERRAAGSPRLNWPRLGPAAATGDPPLRAWAPPPSRSRPIRLSPPSLPRASPPRSGQLVNRQVQPVDRRERPHGGEESPVRVVSPPLEVLALNKSRIVGLSGLIGLEPAGDHPLGQQPVSRAGLRAGQASQEPRADG
jgi:hypothetical protein